MRVAPTPLPEPYLVAHSPSLMGDMGLDPAMLGEEPPQGDDRNNTTINTSSSSSSGSGSGSEGKGGGLEGEGGLEL